MSGPHPERYGWVAVPRNRQNVPSNPSNTGSEQTLHFDNLWPHQSPIVKQALEDVGSKLPNLTLNHSMRVFYYGHLIVTQHFPDWAMDDEFWTTWALTCLYHDIGTTPENTKATRLSFEFQGGFLALEWIKSHGGPTEQAESVCESIIRHQDPGETGTISRMGQLVQLATEFDNMGYNSQLVDKGIIDQVTARFPRGRWSSCFAATIHDEIDEKPWCHSTAIPGFEEAILGNKLMAPYEM